MLVPTLCWSSTNDFSNGREIAVAEDRIVVAQDANDGNDNQNRLLVYQFSDSQIELKQEFDVSFNLWGIFSDVDRLYAIIDNSNQLAIFDNFFQNTEASIMPDKIVAIEGLVRTHGIFYDKESDLMILTDVGEASSPDDGALFLINNFSLAIDDDLIESGEYVLISGDQTQLGNPVDVAYDPFMNMIHVAERANDGGKVLSFQNSNTGGNIIPSSSISIPGASAIYTTGSEIKGMITTSTEEISLVSESDILVYPNPSDDYVNINLNNEEGEGEYKLSIVSLTGQLIHQQKFNGKARVDVSFMQAGMYAIILESKDKKYQELFTKVR